MKFLYRTKQFILIFVDIISFFIGFCLSLGLRYWRIPSTQSIEMHLTLFIIVFMLWFLINYINGLYDLVRLNNDINFYKRFAQTAIISLIVGIIFFYLLPNREITPKTILALTVLFGYGLSALLRFFFQSLLGKGKMITRVMLVGVTNEALELTQILKQNPKRGYKITACINPEDGLEHACPKNIDIYKTFKAIRPAITTHKIDLVVVAPHIQNNERATRELYELLFWDVQMANLASFYELITGRIPPSTFSESWFLDHLRNKNNPVYNKVRTVADYLTCACMWFLFIALFPIIALAIKINSKGPIIFKQKRVGKYGKIFYLYKFRSMYALSEDGSAETAGAQFAIKNDERATFVGKILRRTHLDELPQCINLIKREISIIGPRPERPEIVRQLQDRMPYYPLRHILCPGLTGWAVLHQNYTDTLETSLQKLQYDLYYIKNRSFLLDLSILLRTINVVLRLKGQ